MATLSAKEAARELGTDARRFRKFMREHLEKDAQPGQGNRYAIEAKDMKRLKKAFDEWAKGKPKPAEADGEKPAAKRGKTATEEVDEDLTNDGLEEIDISDLEEPDAEDLDAEEDADTEDENNEGIEDEELEEL